MLAGGRVVVMGAEYNYDVFVLTNTGAIYEPVDNTWTVRGRAWLHLPVIRYAIQWLVASGRVR